MGKLIIIRGVPGTGKSTLAKERLHECFSGGKNKIVHLEADMFFSRFGEYRWNPDVITRAHKWCIETTQVFLSRGYDVIVSNTFTTFAEMRNYIEYVEEFEHDVEVITLTDEYGSIHDVPEHTMEKMRYRFESHQAIMEKVDGIHQ